MAMSALKLDPEGYVEDRVAVLEANVDHIRSDISEMKIDIRKLNDKVECVDHRLTGKIDAVDQKLTAKIDAVDEKLTGKIDAVDQKLTAKIDAVDEKLTGKIDAIDQKLTTKIDAVDQRLTTSLANLALSMEKAFSELKVGRAFDRVWWLLMSGALLGIMARAFKWL